MSIFSKFLRVLPKIKVVAKILTVVGNFLFELHKLVDVTISNNIESFQIA
jgi:hypothetical protein